VKTVSPLTCPKCDTAHRARKCPPPRSFGGAHQQGMLLSGALRQVLASKVAGLIDFAGGSAAKVAEHLGMPEWRVLQLAAGSIDPTLGEIGRIANLRGAATLDGFLRELLDDGRHAHRH
jgi:hypothetical protein